MDNTMGSPLKPWPKLDPMSNARLRRQPTLEETAAKPLPAYIPGQLSLWIEAADYPGVVGEILLAQCGEFCTWRPA